jgi:hypothetical protein
MPTSTEVALRITIEKFKREFIYNTMSDLQTSLTEYFEKDLGYSPKRINAELSKLNKRLPEHLRLQRGSK